MPDILDIFNNQNVIDYVANKEYDAQAGEALFPSMKQESLEMEYLKGSNEAPVTASVHAFDTESEIASRDGGQLVREKIAFIKRKIQVNEELLLRLNSIKETSPAYKSIIDTIYNDIDNMVSSVKVRVERMRYEALATGKVTANENHAKFEVNYGFRSDQLQTADWSQENADILGDIDKWIDSLVLATGITPGRILTTRQVVRKIANSVNIKKAILGDSTKRLSLTEINDFMVAHGLPVLGTEDRMYREQKADGTYAMKRYLPEGSFVLLPNGALGNTVFGPTPEELRLRQNPAVDLTNVGNVLAMVYDESVDPVATYTKAVATALPSFPTAGQVVSATVLPNLPGA
ncbi:major capsid protein [Facklamia sp. P13069]|uniref:major capsid protein n=1 Tax=Facklamia sp. P13069 TaxID=3421954 RepID=UPI003D182F97